MDNEHHNWLWCSAHSLGLVTTLTERRNWLIQNQVIGIIKGGNDVPIDWKTASSTLVNTAYNSVQSAQFAETLGTSLCFGCTVGYYAVRTLGTSGAGTVAGLLPSLDETGKVHGPLPDHVPDNWTREEMEHLAGELRQSIRTRNNELLDMGEENAHRKRIGQEERLLRQLEKKLGGS